MELLRPSQAKTEKWMWMGVGACLASAAIFSLFWLSFLVFQKTQNSVSFQGTPLPKVDFSRMGKGLLAISPQVTHVEFESLVQDLIVIGKDNRPDNIEKFNVSLGLKCSGENKELKCGENVFLSKKGTIYQFSEEKTGLRLIPVALKGSDVVMQIETDTGVSEQVALSPSALFQPSMEDEPYVHSLAKGRMWAPDLFLSQWGGEEYRELSSKSKLEVDHRVHFLNPGDILWWDGGAWQTGFPEIPAAPLARLESASERELKLEVWDSTGYGYTSLSVPLAADSKTSFIPDKLITGIKPRAASEITCQLGKRRVIVKEGDWWVKMDRRWRPLRNADDLDAFLLHQIQGELFIFEKVENTKGKVILKGRCFDKMRTESQPLSLVVNIDKKKTPTRNRLRASHSSMIAKNKMPLSSLQQRSAGKEEKQ